MFHHSILGLVPYSYQGLFSLQLLDNCKHVTLVEPITLGTKNDNRQNNLARQCWQLSVINKQKAEVREIGFLGRPRTMEKSGGV